MESSFSWRGMLRGISEKSVSLLATDITRESRAERRKRECAKRGIQLAVKSERRSVLQGVLGKGSATAFAVNGKDIKIDEATWVFGELRPGVRVMVMVAEDEGIQNAKKIIVQGM